MLRTTKPFKFFKNYKTKHATHPGRRWLYHKFLFVGVVGTAVYLPTSFYIADNMEENGNTFGPSAVIHLIEMLPLNMLSRATGALATSEYLPTWIHHQLIRMYAKTYNANLHEAEAPSGSSSSLDIDSCDIQSSVEKYATLQEFFIRRLKEGSRNINKEALAVSPCDGTLLRCGEVKEDQLLLQVKGCTYSVQNLFRTTLPPPKPESEMKRLFFSFHLGPGDYHRFHSPVSFVAKESILMPGLLFPVMRSATKWFPMLYVNNERVVVHGTIPGVDDKQFIKLRSDIKSDESVKNFYPPEYGERKVGLAFVGAMNVGSVHLNFDERVKSNLTIPPEYAVHRAYPATVAPFLQKGQEIGRFEMGSSIVLVIDVPKDANIIPVQGAKVKVGEPLVSRSNRHVKNSK